MQERPLFPEPKKLVAQDQFSLTDLNGRERQLSAHAVDALGQIALSDTWQSDWLRAPREQIDLAAEAEQWQRLHDAYEVGLDDLRRRAEEAVALRIAVDDVADLIAEADKRRIEADKLTEGETLAAQILAESPEHARAADRLAELTAATGSVHEVLALEIAADIDAINTAVGALSAGAELT